MPAPGLSADEAIAELHRLQARLLRARTRLKAVEQERPGATPREAIDAIGNATLYRYHGGAAHASAGEPVLIVYALVNRPDMIDLKAGRSLVQGLLERGFDVYLLDWGRPQPADAGLGLHDYIGRWLDDAVTRLCRRLGRRRLNLLGICQGGTFALCYTALFPERVERLALTVTPIDFQTTDDLLSRMVRHVDLDALTAAWKLVDGDMLNALFLSLKPNYLLRQKYLDLLGSIDDADSLATFMRMEHWIFDSPALPGRVCREFGQAFYQRNELVAGTLKIGGRPVQPSKITCPVLNVYATRDHLVPPASSRALQSLVTSAPYTEYAIKGGHIGIYVRSASRDGVPALVANWVGTA